MLSNLLFPPYALFRKVKLRFGGAGLYSSIKDYLTLLRHLLQIKGKEVSSLTSLIFCFIQLLFQSWKSTTKPNPFCKNCWRNIHTCSPIVCCPQFRFLCVWCRHTCGQSVGHCTGSAHQRSAWKAQERFSILYVYTFSIGFPPLLCTFLSIALMLLGFGWAGTFGHIDPEMGVAAIFATQVPPSPDGELFQVYDECERILYSNLEKDWTVGHLV